MSETWTCLRFIWKDTVSLLPYSMEWKWERKRRLLFTRVTFDKNQCKNSIFMGFFFCWPINSNIRWNDGQCSAIFFCVLIRRSTIRQSSNLSMFKAVCRKNIFRNCAKYERKKNLSVWTKTCINWSHRVGFAMLISIYRSIRQYCAKMWFTCPHIKPLYNFSDRDRITQTVFGSVPFRYFSFMSLFLNIVHVLELISRLSPFILFTVWPYTLPC